jgi:hypothetical protein
MPIQSLMMMSLSFFIYNIPTASECSYFLCNLMLTVALQVLHSITYFFCEISSAIKKVKHCEHREKRIQIQHADCQVEDKVNQK